MSSPVVLRSVDYDRSPLLISSSPKPTLFLKLLFFSGSVSRFRQRTERVRVSSDRAGSQRFSESPPVLNRPMGDRGACREISSLLSPLATQKSSYFGRDQPAVIPRNQVAIRCTTRRQCILRQSCKHRLGCVVSSASPELVSPL